MPCRGRCRSSLLTVWRCLDYAGPYEVFNVAGEVTSPSAFTVASVGLTQRPVGRGGFRVIPDFTLADAPASDVLVVPGGAGSRALVGDEDSACLATERATRSELLMTVCTGALVAAAAGLLDGLEATTHHSAFDELAAISPRVSVVKGRRFVRSSDDDPYLRRRISRDRSRAGSRRGTRRSGCARRCGDRDGMDVAGRPHRLSTRHCRVLRTSVDADAEKRDD